MAWRPSRFEALVCVFLQSCNHWHNKYVIQHVEVTCNQLLTPQWLGNREVIQLWDAMFSGFLVLENCTVGKCLCCKKANNLEAWLEKVGIYFTLVVDRKKRHAKKYTHAHTLLELGYTSFPYCFYFSHPHWLAHYYTFFIHSFIAHKCIKSPNNYIAALCIFSTFNAVNTSSLYLKQAFVNTPSEAVGPQLEALHTTVLIEIPLTFSHSAKGKTFLNCWTPDVYFPSIHFLCIGPSELTSIPW